MNMPIPQMTVLKIDHILETKELISDSSNALPKEFKHYCSEIREK